MSKKSSARSKGYRKYAVSKKPMLSPSQWKKVGICAAVVLLAILLAVFLCDDGSLKIDKDGNVIVSGVNPLVVNVNDAGDASYYRIGEIPEILEGFKAEKVDMLRDKNEPLYTFVADDEASETINSYTMIARHGQWRDMPDKTMKTVTSTLPDCQMGEAVYTKLAERDVSYYSYIYARTNTSDSSIIEGYSQSLSAYVASNRKDSYVLISILKQLDDPEDAVPTSDLEAILEQVVCTISFDK